MQGSNILHIARGSKSERGECSDKIINGINQAVAVVQVAFQICKAIKE